MTDALHFFGLESMDDDHHWRMEVVPELTTPGHFLFGGCGLGAGLAALEAATGRQTVWATAQYLSFAPTGAVLDLDVLVAAAGKRVSQARVVVRSDDKEILTVNAAVGSPGTLDVDQVWVDPPDVPRPEECPPRRLPDYDLPSIFDRIDVRLAHGRTFEELRAGAAFAPLPSSALWAKVPGHLDPSAATLAIFADYLTGAVSQSVGRSVMSRSLDNTLRVVQLETTEWVLCENRIHSVVGGHAEGNVFLWSERGTLLAVASQSMSVRLWEQ